MCKRLFLLLFWSVPFLSQADDRLPIPEPAAQQKAADLVNDVFGDEKRKATTLEKKSALVKKLLEQAEQPTNAAASRFALFRLAVDVAPDANIAMSVIDRMAGQFQIDALDAKAYTIRTFSDSAQSSSEQESLAEAALKLVDSYLNEDEFDKAEALGEIADNAAKKSRNTELIRSVRSKTAQIAELKDQFEEVKSAMATLEANPVDPKANGIVGKYRCFKRGDWQDGLPLLALSDDDEMKELATSELNSPTQSGKRVALADGWYSQAEKSRGETKERMLQRASHWYQLALRSQPILSGLVRAKVEKRIDEIGKVVATTRPKEIADGPFAPFVGTWSVRYEHGHGRQYVIDSKGTVSFAGNRGTLSMKDEQVILDFRDGKLERLRLDADILRVEHFNPATKFPNVTMLAVGMKVEKVEKFDFDQLAGIWSIKFSNKAERVYSVDKLGNVAFLNSPNKERGKISLANGEVLLEFPDGSLERLHLKGKTLHIERFNPKSEFPHKITWYGIGTRIRR